MLAIVGNFTGIHDNPVFQTDKEIWAFGGRGPYLPRLDRLFQLHLPYMWEENASIEYWLKTNKIVPVYMREQYPEFPMSKRYSFEAAFALLDKVKLKGEPLKYFTSSPALAIALAVLEKRPRIDIYGIELIDDAYVNQKDCIAFWLGFAAGRGTEINLECMESIFKRPLYGAQREP